MADTHSMTPPRWADAWLRTLLPMRDRETVSGDLLEEYRENVRPQRSRFAADLWYVAQVSVFAWRPALWAVALAAILIGRTALDWFVPAANLAPRAELTTLMTASVLLVLGASSTLRTQSVSAGAITTFSVLVLSAALCTIGNALLLARWQSPELVAAINRTGGLPEVFALPVLLIVPGTVIGGIGATLAGYRYRGGNAATD